MEKKEILNLYSDVKNSISDAMKDSFADSYNNKEENDFAKNIKNELEKLNSVYKQEIENLEKSTEWDKLCISFFGETNAGKSTIVETLRIIYNEETRLQKILENKEKIETAFNNNNRIYEEFVKQTKDLVSQTKEKSVIVSAKSMLLSHLLTVIISVVAAFFLYYFIFK